MKLILIRPDKDQVEKERRAYIRKIFKEGFEAGLECEARELKSRESFRRKKFNEYFKK